jgi:hypothetical protein
MRKEFESELARKVSEKRRSGKAWVMIALSAAILVSGAVAVTAAAAYDQDRVRLQLKDASEDCDPVCDSDCDGICDSDCDGICDSDCDATCDCPEDCTCGDCPCCA